MFWYSLSNNDLRISKITKTRLERKALGRSVSLETGVFVLGKRGCCLLRRNVLECNLYVMLLPRGISFYSLVERSSNCLKEQCLLLLKVESDRRRRGGCSGSTDYWEDATGRVIAWRGTCGAEDNLAGERPLRTLKN